MARSRIIKPKFWDDTKVGRITRDARLLYIGLWNFSDDIGVVVGDSIWLKSKIFPYDQIQVHQFEKWMNELVINGFICLLSYKRERFIYLPNFTRHQVVNRPNYDDLNIPKVLIDRVQNKIHGLITDQSLINHGTITDESVPIIKIEEEIEYNTPYNPPIGDDRSEKSDDLKIDYNALMETFNKMFEGNLPKLSFMTDKRKKAVKARASEHGKESIMIVFNNIISSPFLLGHNEKKWCCDFDWIFRQTNFIKILEGNYNKSKLGSHSEIGVILTDNSTGKYYSTKEKELEERWNK